MDWSFSTGDGPWAVVPFNAVDYTATAPMTWTVDQADVNSYAYSIRGKTIVLAVNVYNSSVGGTPSLELQVKLPLGLIVKRKVNGYCLIGENGSLEIGGAFVEAGNTSLRIRKVPNTNFSLSTNGTLVFASLTFEVE